MITFGFRSNPVFPVDLILGKFNYRVNIILQEMGKEATFADIKKKEKTHGSSEAMTYLYHGLGGEIFDKTIAIAETKLRHFEPVFGWGISGHCIGLKNILSNTKFIK